MNRKLRTAIALVLAIGLVLWIRHRDRADEAVPGATTAAATAGARAAGPVAPPRPTRWLGRVAGNLALIAGARGGVYLAGGILPRWGAHFDVEAFRRAFEDKAPYNAWLAAIPTTLVTHPHPGLIGLAVLAAAGP